MSVNSRQKIGLLAAAVIGINAMVGIGVITIPSTTFTPERQAMAAADLQKRLDAMRSEMRRIEQDLERLIQRLGLAR